MKNNITCNSIVVKRNYSIDVLRIICMFFIIFNHFVSRSNLDLSFQNGIGAIWTTSIFYSFSKVATNIFFLISSFYLYQKNSFNLKRIIWIWLQTFLVSIFFVTIFYGTGIVKIEDNINDFILSFFPIIATRYWFITSYFFFILICPLLNKMFKAMTTKNYIYSFVIITILSFVSHLCIRNVTSDILPIQLGYNLIWTICISFYGSFLFKIKEKLVFNKKILSLAILILIFLNFIIIRLSFSYPELSFLFESITIYPFFGCLLLSLLFFILFLQIKIEINNERMFGLIIKKTIFYVVQGILMCYLITDNPFFRNWIYQYLNINSYSNTFLIFPIILGYSFLFFIIPNFIGILFYIIHEKINKSKIFIKMYDKAQKFINYLIY